MTDQLQITKYEAASLFLSFILIISQSSQTLRPTTSSVIENIDKVRCTEAPISVTLRMTKILDVVIDLNLLLLLLLLTGIVPACHFVDAERQVSPAAPSFLFLLIDDVGWADLSYNNGTALTPNIDAWASRSGSMKLQDFHSAGTVCSPTRASILTGRHPFRDCVDHVYNCDDMSECVPDFEFAPSRTFTVGDAVRQAAQSNNPDYLDGIFFAGKWHLGSFYNDSELYGGVTSSPITHGFDHFNATVEVAPTATTNCQCQSEWQKHCQFGHNGKATHCSTPDRRCCFNYWWDDPLAPHGVANLTWPTPEDDSLYLADSFERFLDARVGGTDGINKPFLAQISFHNCHKPFIGTKKMVQSCARNETCRPPGEGDPPYTPTELDYYACLTQLDSAVSRVLHTLEERGYYENTMIWFASDNGPAGNCPPTGICQDADTHPHRPVEDPGSAGPLRGRQRDVYEGGHRVPGIVSWPAVIHGPARESWETVVTTDFLPTVMEVLGVERPSDQKAWAFDGRSILPLMHGRKWVETQDGVRSFGLAYFNPIFNTVDGWAYRFGPWKFVQGSASCEDDSCLGAQLYNLEADLAERVDLGTKYPEMLLLLQHKFLDWFQSVMNSRKTESKCRKVTNIVLPPGMEDLRKMVRTT